MTLPRTSSCKRTKTTHIVTEALAPNFDRHVEVMCREQKFSVMIDESNDQGGDKMLAVLVRVYNTTVHRVTTLFLGMPVCNIGTSENIFNCLKQLFLDRGIPWSQCIGFSSDNCNVMIGKHNSVLTRVREKNEEIFDMGCVCGNVKGLPLPVEDLLINVFFHFHHSAKRKEELKEFQEFTDTEPMKLLKHCGTRSYFQSHKDNEKAGRIERCAKWLSSDLMLLFYAFLEFVLPILNEFNTTFQAGESMIGIMDAEMTRLLRKLMGRFVTTKVITAASDITKVDFQKKDNQHGDELLAVGWRARNYIVDNEIPLETTQKFFSSIRDFYMPIIKVMLAKFPFKDFTLKAMGYVNPDTKDRVIFVEVQQQGSRFLSDDREFLDHLEDEAQDYIVTPPSELPSTDSGLSVFWEDLGGVKLPGGTPRKRRLGLLGNGLRMPQERTVKKEYNSQPEEKRKVGRPKRRWKDGVEGDLKRMGPNRWRKKIENRAE
ncbi:Zinc finger BED domain-containing protein 5 [Nymphon striatum]|nr:Zinc finger BED domain-containing protein 5 [Nymphon striatum]